jgi:hypothetical protein
MPVAGVLCGSPQLGWPAVFYVLGAMTLIAFAGFFLLYRDSPRVHP